MCLQNKFVYSLPKNEACALIKLFITLANTGTITLLTTLDYELEQFYNLTVLAEDSGSPPLNSTAVVEITVEDYNDCIPQFTSAQYIVERLENSTTGELQ